MRKILIVILILAGFAERTDAEKHYLPSFTTGGDTVVAVGGHSDALFEAVEVRAAMLNPLKGHHQRPDCIGFKWRVGTSDTTVTVTLTPGIEGAGMAIETPFVELRAEADSPSGCRTLISRRLTSDIGFDRQPNSFAAEFENGAAVRILAGKNLLNNLGSLPAAYGRPTGLTLLTHGKARIIDLIHELRPDPSVGLQTRWTRETLADHFRKSPMTHEGFWKYLDRNTDDGYTQLGGHYLVGIVGDGRDGFDIIYLGGAQTNARRWHPGMLKGRLTPTVFSDHYNLTWYSSGMDAIELECNASFTDDAVLTLSFPLLKSSIRLSRVIPSELKDM